jgi:hypothetical protein
MTRKTSQRKSSALYVIVNTVAEEESTLMTDEPHREDMTQSVLD